MLQDSEPVATHTPYIAQQDIARELATCWMLNINRLREYFMMCKAASSASNRSKRHQDGAFSIKYVVLLVLIFLLQHAQPVFSHGMLIRPMSRNFWGHMRPDFDWKTKEYNPYGLNGGGVAKISKGRTLLWPNGEHGRCGEAVDASPEKYGSKASNMPVRTYRLGGTIEFHVLIHAHHLGRFTFRLCPTRFRTEKECIALQRADGQGPLWYLPPPKNLQTDLSPAREDATFKWYRYPVNNDYRNMPVFVLRYQLPEALPWGRVQSAVVQWYWLTANSCTPSCNPADPNYPQCSEKAGLKYCGAPRTSYPEEFWNCADINLIPPKASIRTQS